MTTKLRKTTADDEPDLEVCARVSNAAARAVQDACQEAGVQLAEMVVVVRIDGHPEGENPCSTIAYPPDQWTAITRMFNSACSMLEAATGKAVNLNFLPHEAQRRVRAMRASEHRPSTTRGRGKRRPR